MKGQSRLYVRKYSFSQRTVNEWNKLSADCVHSSTINMLRTEYNYLIRTGYTYVDTCGLSVIHQLPGPQPYGLLLGWQSCYLVKGDNLIN